MLIVIEAPASTFFVPVHMGHRWDVKISVIQEPNNLWSTPNPVQQQWPRAVLTALPGGCAPSGQLHFCQQRKSWSQQLWSRPAVGEVRGGGRPLLLTQPCTRRRESIGLRSHVCQASCPSPSVMQGPSLRATCTILKRASYFNCSTVSLDNHPVVQLYTLTVICSGKVD